MAHFMGEAFDEMRFHLVEVNAVLGSLGSCKSGNHIVQIQFEHGRVGFLSRVLAVPESLSLGVGFDTRHCNLFSPRQAQVFQGALVDREETACCAVFGRHVGDGGTVRQREGFHAGSKELHEFANHAVFTQHLNDSQGHVRRRHSWLKIAREANTDHVGCEHVDGLAEHDRFGFNPADAPTEHTESVDHRRVRIRSDQRIGQPHAFFLASDACQKFEVDLMDNSTGRRHGLEIGQRLLPPLEEGVALHVAVVFNVEVHIKRIAVSP